MVLFVLDKAVVTITAGYRTDGQFSLQSSRYFPPSCSFCFYYYSLYRATNFSGEIHNTGYKEQVPQGIKSRFHDDFQFLLLLSASSIHLHPWKCALVKGKRYGNISSYIISPWYPATFVSRPVTLAVKERQGIARI